MSSKTWSLRERSLVRNTPSPRPSACRCSCNECRCNRNLTETTPLLANSASSTPTPPPPRLSWNEKLPYYLPFLDWLPKYNSRKLVLDMVSGLSLASFQIPLAMSYATTILHVPVICGLFAVLVPPLVYAMFGSIPQLIVGPEPSISIVVGGIVEPMLLHDPSLHLKDLVMIISFLSGAFLFGAGLLRFGFLDTVLSVALLKGFIAAVGVVMVCNSSFDELGLKLPQGHDIHSPFDKLKFVLTHLDEIHWFTFWISFGILMSLLVLRFFKRKMIQLKYENFIFLPEILLTVIVSTILSYQFEWDQNGVSIVGSIRSSKMYWNFPLHIKFWPSYKLLISTGMTCAILGFFESTTLSKAIGGNESISSNRELVALGMINMVGGSFGALPLFGGYGRSKINIISGGKTCASGGFMSIFTLVVIFFLLKFLYFLPNCCLSCITTIVGLTILEEIPSELIFFWKTRGWEELITFLITFVFAFGVSMDMGIIMGTSYSIIRILKNSSKSRIQILKRLNGEFVDADNDFVDDLELQDIANCLIVKIPEPLIFTNTNDVKLKLKKFEMYGSRNHHPATPRFQPFVENVIFDINEMLDIDSSSAQILLELIQNYHKRHIQVFLVCSKTNPGVKQMMTNSGIFNYTVGEAYFESIDECLSFIDEQNSSNDNFNDVASYHSLFPLYI